MQKTLLIIPTYNEKPNINKLLRRLFQLSDEIDVLIVDDNSPDGTGKIVDDLCKTNPRLHVIHRQGKLGLGSAYVRGFKYSIEKGYENVITMDADFSHRPRYVPDFLKNIKKYDMVIGSRWIPKGRVVRWSPFRLFLSRTANIYTEVILGNQVKDWTGGFNSYRCELLKKINPDNIRSDGYSFQIEMKYRALKNHGRVVEIPITFPDRKEGKSKISRHIVWEALFIVWRFRFTNICNGKA